MNSSEEKKLNEKLTIVKRYKYSILSVVVLSLIMSIIYAYYKPNIYEADAIVQINTNTKEALTQDTLKSALRGDVQTNIDTEKEVLQTRFMVLKAMKHIDLTTHIWGVNSLFKSIELYKHSPFKVTISKGKGVMFKVTPKDLDNFHLSAKGVDENGEKFKFSGNFKFGEEIENDYFKLKLSLTGSPFKYSKYKFIVYDPLSYAEDIKNFKLNVSKLNKKANMLNVSYKDSVAIRAKEFVNALVKEYIKQNIKLKTQDATKTLELIDQQLGILKTNLNTSEKNIEEFNTKQNTANIDFSIQDVSQKLSDYENRVGILDMKISILRTSLKKLKTKKGLSTLTLAGIGEDSVSITPAIRELQQAILDRDSLLESYTYAHPVVKKITKRINNMKIIIKGSIEDLLKSYLESKKILHTQMAKYQKVLSKLPKAQQNYLGLKRKFDFNNKFYTYLLKKKTEAEIKKAAAVSQNRIVDLALLPEVPIKPKRKLIITVGVMFGLVLGVILAFIRNAYDNTVKDTSEIEDILDIPIAATIPHHKKNGTDSRELVVMKKPKSAFAESFRLLRTNLKFLAPKALQSTVVAVSSTVAGEGKTSVVANLAVALQMLNKRVIIINLDLRKPTLHTVFGMANGHGLSAYLSDQVGLDKILKHTNIEKLDIIPAGSVPPNPSELISSDRMFDLIERLKKYYDYIILDTPPVGIITDARVILDQADITLYVVRAGYTKKELLNSVKKLYKELNKKNFAIVLNDAESDLNAGYGYYEER